MDAQVQLQLRRPLFLFGGSLPLVAPTEPLNMGAPAPYFAPDQQLYAPLADETKLRIMDPNANTPLLSSYDLQFDITAEAAPPVTAAAGTFDGQSVLATDLAFNLHVVDTLRLQDQGSTPLNDTLPPQSIIISPSDHGATVLLYQNPPPLTGRSGHILFINDLVGLRSGTSGGQELAVDIAAGTVNPVGVPLSAAYAPDGLVDVLITPPPVQSLQPNCATLSSSNSSLLQRYDPQSGTVQSQIPLPYTTAVAYTEAGARVMVQPCTTAPNATRPGQVIIQNPDNSTPELTLSAPGSTTVTVVENAIISVGSADIADGETTIMTGAVRVLEPNQTTWMQSQFDLSAWQVPYRVSNLPSSVDILFYPTDVLTYGISVTPDRVHALVLMRVLHETYPESFGLYLDTNGNPGNSQSCYVQWIGYTYHVLLINLQNGTREQDYLLGVQNQSCSSTLRSDTPPYPIVSTTCFSPCDSTSSNPYLIGYQAGYIPSAASVLFGRR
jgi:hypothetical protein